MKLEPEKILNLSGIVVKRFEEIEGYGLFFDIEVSSKQASCPRCNKVSRSLHQNHWRVVQDLPISNWAVFLRINRRQFKCKNCLKPFSEPLYFVDQQRSYTERFAKKILQEVIESNIHSVAVSHDLTDEEIQSMLESVGQHLLKAPDLRKLSKLGIDEIALVKGQGNYLAVLVDLEQKKPIAILPSRRQEDLRACFESWGAEVLHQIKEVSIDLWKPYKNLVEELMPDADIIADRFHVMKIINNELDSARKEAKFKATAEKDSRKKASVLAGLNKSKYSLLKNECDLNELQREKLREVNKVAPSLGKMHGLKEKFREIFETIQPGIDSVLSLIDWLKEAAHYFTKSRQTILRWFPEVVGYFESRTNSGIVEGINNKIKLIKRLGYGFRNFENFTLRTLLSWHVNTDLA